MSALDHGDVYAADLALGVDLHGLFFAIGADQEIRRKSCGLDEHFDPATTCGALQVPKHVAAGFAPVAGNPLALAGHVAGKVKLVAVAGAAQALLQVQPGVVDLVVCLAANALGGAVGELDRTVAGPCAAQSRKGT